MELPKGAVWMVAIGVLGLIGTGVVYVVEEMPELELDAESSQTTDLEEEENAPDEPGEHGQSKSTDRQPEQVAADSTPEKSPEPQQCRALVNIRVGGQGDEIYDYRVVDVHFDEDGEVRADVGPGVAMREDGVLYTAQIDVEDPQGVPIQVLRAGQRTPDGDVKDDIWRYPRRRSGVDQNATLNVWPVFHRRVRVRSTIGEFVSVQSSVADSEGSLREDSVAIMRASSSAFLKPLQLDLRAIEGRPVAFEHQEVASEQGAEMIWEAFRPANDNFALRLANAAGKSVTPEVGLCCYETEGTSQMVFVEFDRGAFALMAPGYLSRPEGYIRAGDGCGEFGWDGEKLFARRLGEESWTTLQLDGVDSIVQEFLGVYWLPRDDPFDVSELPEPAEWPDRESLLAKAHKAEAAGRKAMDSGEYTEFSTALAQLRVAMRRKMLAGESVDELRGMYAEAVLRAGSHRQAGSYIRERMRVSDNPAEKRAIREVREQLQREAEIMKDLPGR